MNGKVAMNIFIFKSVNICLYNILCRKMYFFFYLQEYESYHVLEIEFENDKIQNCYFVYVIIFVIFPFNHPSN